MAHSEVGVPEVVGVVGVIVVVLVGAEARLLQQVHVEALSAVEHASADVVRGADSGSILICVVVQLLAALEVLGEVVLEEVGAGRATPVLEPAIVVEDGA